MSYSVFRREYESNTRNLNLSSNGGYGNLFNALDSDYNTLNCMDNLKMNPGLDLNILVAIHVMKLDVVKTKSGSKQGGYYYSIGEPIWHDYSGDMQLNNPVPNYSSDIATAWEVVDKITSFSRLYDAEVGTTGADNWYCMFVTSKTFSKNAETAPHAICLAALAAVGYKSKK